MSRLGPQSGVCGSSSAPPPSAPAWGRLPGARCTLGPQHCPPHLPSQGAVPLPASPSCVSPTWLPSRALNRLATGIPSCSAGPSLGTSPVASGLPLLIALRTAPRRRVACPAWGSELIPVHLRAWYLPSPLPRGPGSRQPVGVEKSENAFPLGFLVHISVTLQYSGRL